jgi:hypothetical protein
MAEQAAMAMSVSPRTAPSRGGNRWRVHPDTHLHGPVDGPRRDPGLRRESPRSRAQRVLTALSTSHSNGELDKAIVGNNGSNNQQATHQNVELITSAPADKVTNAFVVGDVTLVFSRPGGHVVTRHIVVADSPRSII